MKVKFLEAREVEDGEGIVIQKFRAGQVVELSNASARHWINRGAAVDVQAAARAAKEAAEEKPEAEEPEAAEEKVAEEKAEVTTGDVDPTSPKSGKAKRSYVRRQDRV